MIVLWTWCAQRYKYRTFCMPLKCQLETDSTWIAWCKDRSHPRSTRILSAAQNAVGCSYGPYKVLQELFHCKPISSLTIACSFWVCVYGLRQLPSYKYTVLYVRILCTHCIHIYNILLKYCIVSQMKNWPGALYFRAILTSDFHYRKVTWWKLKVHYK